MPQYILHKDGAYNIYSTVVDAPLFKEAATLEMLTRWYTLEYGQSGLRDLPDRLERAPAKGTSSMDDRDIEACICLNRAGENESELPLDDFVAKYLTLPAQEMTEQEAIDLNKSGWWKKATAVEIVRRQLFEPRAIMNMGDFQLALATALGHPVFTGALGSKVSVEAMKKEFINLHGDPTNA